MVTSKAITQLSPLQKDLRLSRGIPKLSSSNNQQLLKENLKEVVPFPINAYPKFKKTTALQTMLSQKDAMDSEKPGLMELLGKQQTTVFQPKPFDLPPFSESQRPVLPKPVDVPDQK